MSPRTPSSPFCLILLCAVTAAAWASCSATDEDRPLGNRQPFVRISGGPPQGTEDSYTTRVWWTGWDDDGVIEHYEYAIDPPPAFSEAEVNAPEAHPSIRRQVIRGPQAGRDTVRFTKSVDGAIHRFDFVQTTDFSRVFAFRTPRADSGNVGGNIRGPLPRFSGVHALYIRCVDNEGSYSDVDRLGYTAVTMTPTATIERPKIGGRILTVGTQLNVGWSGVDPDATDPRRRPVGYLYKLVRLDKLSPPIPILSATDPGFILFRAARDIPWVYRSADTPRVSLLVEPGSYVFGVRAVDQAGSVEPYLNYTRSSGPGNAFPFSVVTSGGKPTLTVTEPSLGTASFRGLNGQPVRYQVAIGQRLYFEWSATAEDYGGVIEGYNWGVDVPDIEREGPNSGWRGWSLMTGNSEAVVFNRPGLHVVYVKVRDAGGAQSLATILLTVIDFPLDREILVVDDYRDGVHPNDAQHDAFWTRLLEDSGRFTAEELRPEISRYAVHGPQDNFFYEPVPPDLETFSRYRHIVWETKGGGAGGTNGLLEAGPIARHLSTFLRVGGRLWVSGEMTVASTIVTQGGLADFNYPHELEEGYFPWDFFRIYSERVDNVKYVDLDQHGMIGVEPFPGGAEPFPAMTVDPSKQRPGLGGTIGVGGTDIVVDPIYNARDPRGTGRIDSLYVYRAIGPTRTPPRGSPYHGKLCAIRYRDTDPNPSQGRTIWFGFSLYYMNTGQVQEVFNRAIDWLREDEGTAP